VLALALAGCGHTKPLAVVGPEIEIAHDEGRADQRPLTPGQTFEMLVRIDPRLRAFRLSRMRFQVAQSGRIVFTVYASDGEGRPGAALKSFDHDYRPEMVTAADGDKWVVEDLSDVPVQHGPVFIGLFSPEKTGDARLWATSNDSGNAFQRDADPSVPLAQLKIPRTPRLRVTIAPAD
jgi:hypothetical protein